MRRLISTVIVVGATVSAAAQAAPKDVLQPLQLSNESIRFDRGDYVIDLAGQRAAVQIRSMPSDHGYLSFVVLVLNTGPDPVNLDVGNFRVTGGTQPIRVLTRAEMQQRAERRAGWAKFFTSLGGALVASAQANQRNDYSVVTTTPYGTIHSSISTPCYGCQLAAGYTLARTDGRLAEIRGTLDQTRAALGEQMLQLTTIDPGRVYGGRIFLDKFNQTSARELHLTMTVGQESFEFGFRFAPAGSPTPSYRMVTPSTPVPLAPVPAGPAPIYASSVRMAPPPVATPQPAAVTVPGTIARAPLPPGRASPSGGVSAAIRAKWTRYYRALLASGTAASEAKLIADGEFGPID